MSLDALARVGSYFGSYLGLSSKGTVQATVKTAKLALSYCMYPPGSKSLLRSSLVPIIAVLRLRNFSLGN